MLLKSLYYFFFSKSSNWRVLCFWGAFLWTSIQLSGQIKPITPFGTTRALVVGVSDYQHPKIPDLDYAHRDAEAFATLLEKETDWKVEPEHLVLLTNEQATYAKFINELNELKNQCLPKDRLIIYFSGHGDVEIKQEKMGYLLFYDAAPTTYAAGGACSVATLDEVLKEIVLDQQTEVILISDACRSGSLTGQSIGGPRMTNEALSQLFNNTIKIMSCEPDQFSVEGPQWGGGRGVFSYHLTKGLAGLADVDENRYVDLFEIERYVQDSVRAVTQRAQLPVAKGLGRARISRVNPEILAKLKANLQMEIPLAFEELSQDTSFLPMIARFDEAVEEGQLLFPPAGSAYEIYQQFLELKAPAALKKVMKIDLATALQDVAQQAINDYITSPNKELSKRWANQELYAYYPDYLAKAAALFGADNFFYRDIRSREHYFRGLNMRLKADAGSRSDSLYQAALVEQQKALEFQPMAPHVHNEMGLLYRRLKKRLQEFAAFQKALALSPNWSLALTNLAFTYEEMGETKEAEQIYLKTIELDTALALSYFNLGMLYDDLERYPKAIQYYQKTIEKDATFSYAYYNLAYLQTDQPKLAEANLLRYLELSPDDSDGYDLLAYIYQSNDAYEQSIQISEKSLELNPNGVYATKNIGQCLHALGLNAEASTWIEKSLRLTPNDLSYRELYVRTLSLLGQSSKALLALEELLKKGYKDYDNLMKHPDLDQLRKLAAFEELMKVYFPQ